MSRIKVLVAAAFAVLALLTVTSIAGAQPLGCTITGTTVTCTGDLTNLPPGITHVALTVDYACAYAFHPEVAARYASSTEGVDIIADGHGNATYKVTVTAPSCQGGTTVPVPTRAYVVLSQSGFTFFVIGPITL